MFQRELEEAAEVVQEILEQKVFVDVRLARRGKLIHQLLIELLVQELVLVLLESQANEITDLFLNLGANRLVVVQVP